MFSNVLLPIIIILIIIISQFLPRKIKKSSDPPVSEERGPSLSPVVFTQYLATSGNAYIYNSQQNQRNDKLMGLCDCVYLFFCSRILTSSQGVHATNWHQRHPAAATDAQYTLYVVNERSRLGRAPETTWQHLPIKVSRWGRSAMHRGPKYVQPCSYVYCSMCAQKLHRERFQIGVVSR